MSILKLGENFLFLNIFFPLDSMLHVHYYELQRHKFEKSVILPSFIFKNVYDFLILYLSNEFNPQMRLRSEEKRFQNTYHKKFPFFAYMYSIHTPSYTNRKGIMC